MLEYIFPSLVWVANKKIDRLIDRSPDKKLQFKMSSCCFCG